MSGSSISEKENEDWLLDREGRGAGRAGATTGRYELNELLDDIDDELEPADDRDGCLWAETGAGEGRSTTGVSVLGVLVLRGGVSVTAVNWGFDPVPIGLEVAAGLGASSTSCGTALLVSFAGTAAVTKAVAGNDESGGAGAAKAAAACA